MPVRRQRRNMQAQRRRRAEWRTRVRCVGVHGFTSFGPYQSVAETAPCSMHLQPTLQVHTPGAPTCTVLRTRGRGMPPASSPSAKRPAMLDTTKPVTAGTMAMREACGGSRGE